MKPEYTKNLTRMQFFKSADYYGMSKVYEDLYLKSIKNINVKNLMSIIKDKRNMLIAIRCMKSNTGAETAGIDGITFTELLQSHSTDELHQMVCKLIDNYEDINLIRGSKYVQSYMNNCFQEIKNKIVEGKKVLFFGTPCQVYGLKKYLNYDYDNLITVDLVCKGVASPKLWEKYLNYREEKQQSKVDYINFRKKNRGYHSADLEIKFKNSSVYAKNKTDFFMRSYINSICMRKSCYQCNFKGKDRCSDFTIFDAWNATKYTSLKKDDDKGYTNVLIHTNKGNEILNEISNMYEIYESDISKAIFYDGVMVDNQTEYMKQREKFYELLNQKKIDETVQILLPIKTIDVLMELIKKILYKLGLLNLIKKLKEGLNVKN